MITGLVASRIGLLDPELLASLVTLRTLDKYRGRATWRERFRRRIGRISSVSVALRMILAHTTYKSIKQHQLYCPRRVREIVSFLGFEFTTQMTEFLGINSAWHC
jgi:hypothetical protein